MARETVYIEGLRELQSALSELPKATGKAVLRRVLKKRGQPIADAAQHNAQKHQRSPGKGLAASFAVSTKLSRRQAREHRAAGDRGTVEMFVGAGALPQAHLEEFGGPNNVPHPSLRPAWDQTRSGVLDGIAKDIGDEITKSAARLARKAARAAG